MSFFINFNYNLNDIPSELQNLSDQIYDNYIKNHIIKNNRKDILKHYYELNKILLVNLFNSYRSNKSIKYSKNERFYKKAINEKLIFLNTHLTHNKSITKLTNLYQKFNLISIENGHYDPYNQRNSYLSQISTTDFLNNQFKQLNINSSILPEYNHTFSDDLVVIYEKHQKEYGKKRKGKRVTNLNNLKSPTESVDKLNDRILNIKNKLSSINNKIHNSTFQVNNDIIGSDFFTLKRIFNNSSLVCGGRLYGLFQELTKEERNNIIINGDYTNSLDITASHIRMLYHMRNIDLNNLDPYNIKNHPDEYINKIFRKITKKIILRLINSDNNRIFVKRIHDLIENEFDKHGIDYTEYSQKHFVKSWIDDIYKSFSEINKYFFTGIGSYLQYLEGELLTRVIYDLIQNYDILSLPVHDELIISHEYSYIGKEYLINTYKSFKIFNNYSPLVIIK